jgi:AraC-like DNA-binding protein
VPRRAGEGPEARLAVMGAPQAYVERTPLPSLARAVRTVWVQHTGPGLYVQRNLPTGGAEIQCRVGSVPRLVGPLTAARIELLPAGSTVVGVRFRAGAAAALLGVPADELVDQVVPLDDVWGDRAVRLSELLTSAASSSAEAAIGVLQNHLATIRAVTTHPDPLVATAVRRLMPWETADIGALTRELDISTSQLRRRFLPVVGVAPKTLQRTLRFQGYLALAQAAAADDGPGGGRLADLAAAVGYADQSHLGRECLRLAGLTPRQLLGGRADSCGLGHDHWASYQPFLAGAQGARDARSVQDLVGRAL